MTSRVVSAENQSVWYKRVSELVDERPLYGRSSKYAAADGAAAGEPTTGEGRADPARRAGRVVDGRDPSPSLGVRTPGGQ